MGSIKKFATAFLAVALLAMGAFALAGCGKNDEQVVREGVSAELDKLKALDEETMQLLTTNSGAESLSSYGIEADEFITSYLDGFDYRIDGVKVDGKTATATVVLTCKSFDEYSTKMQEATAALAEDESILSLSADELNQKIGETVMNVIAETPAAETDPIELSFALENNAWSLTSDAQQAISNALFSM